MRAIEVKRASSWSGDAVDSVVLGYDDRHRRRMAAPEPLLEIRCGNPLHLARIAWHLGNRHLPTQLFPKYLRIRRDHVIAEMAAKLGARVIEIEGPFDPEGGAYDAPAHAHGHDHSHHDHHDQGHGHGHSHDHRHGG
jgi:urease accessory protein